MVAGVQTRWIGWHATPTDEHPFKLPAIGQARQRRLVSMQPAGVVSNVSVSNNIGEFSPERSQRDRNDHGATITQGTPAAEQARVASAFEANPPAWSRVTLPTFV